MVVRNKLTGELKYLGLFQRLYKLRPYSRLTAARVVVARIADYIALFGMIATSLLGLRSALRKNPSPIDMAAAVAGAMAFVFTSYKFWLNPVDYTRPFAALFVLVALQGIAERRLWYIVPILMIDVRVVVEWGPRLLQVVGIGG